jgi:DNA invertase Pin-like site-specific DNA recombinase
MKVAIYTRVSTDEQDADKQEFICREYCSKQNLEIYRIYTDVISGSKSSRPEFNELLVDMRNGMFNCVVVTKLDRLGRSLSHLISLMEEFNKRGVHFIATTQNLETVTPSGRLQFQIMGAFAEFERNIISERTKEGMRRAIGVGKRGKDKIPRKRRGGTKKSLFDIQNK